MYAPRIFAGFQGAGRNTLDVPVAALAGLAVAFLAFTAPAGLLVDIVGATGLSSILPAAEPPLGMKARLGIGAGGAVLVFAIAFLVLRWLDRFGARRAEEAEEAAAIVEAPRLRRRDIHPDAPSRPPLLAVHELGEPELELDEVLAEAPEPWLEPASPVARDLPPEPGPEPDGWTAEAPDPFQESSQEDNSQADAYALSQRTWSEEPPVAAEAPDESVGTAEPLGREPVEPVGHSWLPEPAPRGEPRSDDFDLPASAPEPEPEPATLEAAPDHTPGSIPDLMERLEQGLARRRFAPAPQPSPDPVQVAAPEPSKPQAPADDRLQSAIDSLQRFASRQD